MKNNLSLIVITYNSQDTIEKTLKSAKDIIDGIVVVDNYSTDNTVKIAKKYGAKIVYYRGKNRGIQCQLGINKTKNNWVLILDSDEAISDRLRSEIKLRVQSSKFKVVEDGFYIPFQSYYFGRKLYYGGENYKKLILFRKDQAKIESYPIHYICRIKSGKVGQLRNKVDHYSYRNLWGIYKKFTIYAIEDAKLKKKSNEKTSIKKIILYPLHMFWARFINDKGYKDGFFRIPLDLGFAYMEFLTYLSMLFVKKNKRLNN